MSPVLFYDPAGRVVATLHPNHTWEKVVFDPWRQESWDVNDTVLDRRSQDRPRRRRVLPAAADAEYLPTWHAQRAGGRARPEEQAAASKTAMHAATPAVAHADSLGRTFLTVAHNRFKRSDTPTADPPTEEFYATRVDLRHRRQPARSHRRQGSHRHALRLRHARQSHPPGQHGGGRTLDAEVMWRASPSTPGTAAITSSARPMMQLRRPTDSSCAKAHGPERRIGRTIYGESRPNPEVKNQRGKAVQVFDQAGVVTTEEYDFKGNLLASQRQLAREYKATLDWSADRDPGAGDLHEQHDATMRSTAPSR